MKLPKKIMIVYAWGRRNAGDHALILGALEFLSSIIDLSEVIVVARHSNDDPISPIEDIKQKFPTVSVVNPPFDMVKRSGIARIFQMIEILIKVFCAFISPQLMVARSKKEDFWHALKSTRLVLLNGGNLFFWHKVRKKFPRLLALAFPLLIAKRLNIPYGMLPQTCGPFDKGRVATWIGRIFAGASFISFRDKDSMNHLTSIVHLEERKNALLPDLAFSLSPKIGNKDQKMSEFLLEYGDDFFCVCLRVAPLGDDVDEHFDNSTQVENKILSILPESIEMFQKKYKAHCLIVIQVDHDYDISQKLYNKLQKRNINCSMISLNDPYDFLDLYIKTKFLLSFRLHSMIFALGQGTPVIGVWRKPLGTKIPSMMNDMNLEKYVIEIDEINNLNLLDIMNQVYLKRNEIQNHVTNIVAQRRIMAISFIKEFLN